MYLQLGVDGLKGLRNFNVDANVSACSTCYHRPQEIDANPRCSHGAKPTAK